MSNSVTARDVNPLGVDPIGALLLKFAIPAVVGFLVSSLYNIVDQLFIGQGVGMLGNAATNVAFPLSSLCAAIALLFGIGGAASFNISLGAGNKKYATEILGTALTSLIIVGVLLCAVVLIFLEPMLLFFGATADVLPYSITYVSITALGFPFLIFSSGAAFLIRADGSPTYSMLFMVVGAVINTILDPIFIFVLDMGMAGAALATVLGQVVSGVMAFSYIFHYKTVDLKRYHLIPKPSIVKALLILGLAPAFNQVSMSVTQIVLNNTLTYYGANSAYGSDIPLACVGIIVKVNMIFMSFVLGISQGAQPIISFNYGARQYDRAKKTYFTALIVATAFSVLAFLSFQLFPREITSIFGDGSELYYQFATNYFRIYLFMTFCNSIQPLSSNFFTATGHSKLGVLVSLTKQIIFLIPLLLILPIFFGIDGIMFAGPIADATAAITAIILVLRAMKRMTASSERLPQEH